MRRRPSQHLRVVAVVVLALSCLTAGVRAAATRFASVPKAAPYLGISGSVTLALQPGLGQKLDLRVSNPFDFPLMLKQLGIVLSVDASHGRAGCSADQDFSVRQLPGPAYPIRVPPRSVSTLSELGVKRLPRLRMRNRPVDQEACRGASLTLRYSARAERRRP